jgi:hypothetical protein
MKVTLMAGDHVSLQMDRNEVRLLMDMIRTAGESYRQAAGYHDRLFGHNLRELQHEAYVMARTIDASVFPDEE